MSLIVPPEGVHWQAWVEQTLKQIYTDQTRIWRRIGQPQPPAQLVPVEQTGGSGSNPIAMFRLAAPLYIGTNSASAVKQKLDTGSWVDDTPTATIYADFHMVGYRFEDEQIWCFFDEVSGHWYPLDGGGVHFEGTAAEDIAQGDPGDITLTNSRGTVSAIARYGAVVDGDLVSVHWDHHEANFFAGDSECGA